MAVILFNHSDKPFVINRGDRVAQLICERIYYPVLEEEVLAGNDVVGAASNASC